MHQKLRLLGRPDLKNYVGKRFGKLTVMAYAGKEDGMHRWKCRCICGNEAIVGQTNLQSGKTKSCGCLQEETKPSEFHDIDGQRFGRLVAIEPEEERSGGSVI